ncbi:glucose-dependent insulinotropic receptor-like [Liolophura sinensis]|uniref:glucose-dependent insulinotropic receptor-like n=1 Tax=Liolophura sinensis TaxID=3198878 RepID=UPI0031597E00
MINKEEFPTTTSVSTTLTTTILDSTPSSILSSDAGHTPTIHQQVQLVIVIPLAFTIISCNLVVLTFLIFSRKLRKPSYFFIGCMSFADFTVGCVSIWTLEYARDRAFIPCLVRMELMTSAVVASLYCMGWIAVDRYIAILEPFKYNQKMSKFRAGVAMTVIWVAAFCIGFAPLMGWDVEHSTVYCSFCYIDTIEYEVFLFVMGFGVPMCTTIFVYTLVFKNARVHIKRMEIVENVAHCGDNTPSSSRRQCLWRSRRWRSSRTLVLMISCFLITWCPFVVTSVIQMICDDSCDLKDIIGSYLLLLGFCNSFLNPVIYAVSNKEFKSVVHSAWKTFLLKLKCWSETS